MTVQSQQTPTPRGRRGGTTPSRTDILTAARTLFADTGYEGASVRAIAAQAQVDPALIRYFFGSKENLFLALLDELKDQTSPVELNKQGEEGQGAATLRAYLDMWESEQTGPLIKGLVRSALASNKSSPTFKKALGQHLLAHSSGPLAAKLTGASAELLSSHLLGLALGRYLLELPHLAKLSTHELIEITAPIVEGYFKTAHPKSPRTARKKQTAQEQLSLFDGLL